jgi:hypothetical protein
MYIRLYKRQWGLSELKWHQRADDRDLTAGFKLLGVSVGASQGSGEGYQCAKGV